MSPSHELSLSFGLPSHNSPIDRHMLDGLAMLWQAHQYARDSVSEVWDFALNIDSLLEAGMTVSDLRWLVAKRLAKHGLETTGYGDPHRAFQCSEGFSFANAACLVLTDRGAEFAQSVLQNTSKTKQAAQAIEVFEPRWDSTGRLLSVGQLVVKRFRVPARNQEAILDAFEEEGWPLNIDDPLPVKQDMDPHTRLHDAINRLNGRQTNPLLRFHGNGRGTGVSWERR